MANLQDVQVFIDSIELKTELSDFEKEKVLNLMVQPGFRLLLGLLIGERQGLYAQFRNLRAGDAEDARKLGVLQGRIIGVESAAQTLLECATVPAEPEGNK